MRKSRYSDEQIAATLRQAGAGTPIAEITRKLGISEATFYAWRKRFGSLGTPEIRELRQLREENTRLKRLVADLTLDRQVLQSQPLAALPPRGPGRFGSAAVSSALVLRRRTFVRLRREP